MSNIPGGVHKFSGMGSMSKNKGKNHPEMVGGGVSTTGSGSGGRPAVKMPKGRGKDAGGTANLGTTAESVRDMSHPIRTGGSFRPAGVAVHDGKGGRGVKQPKAGTGLMSHEE